MIKPIIFSVALKSDLTMPRVEHWWFTYQHLDVFSLRYIYF